MTDKERFIDLCTQHIHRDGIDELLEWLQSDKCDFFDAPASTQYHLNIAGGLCKHSLHVYDRLIRLYQAEYGEASNEKHETLAIVSLLHDLCKTNFYKLGSRNVKDENGKWQTVPVYTINDTLNYGHGEGSVYIISAFMRLTREEAMAIRWHMGGFDDAVKGGSRALSGAMEKYPLVTLIHIADMMASYLDEVEGE